jgi:hypothetical protein
MATVTLTLESICAGGAHAHISVVVNGVNKGEFAVDGNAIMEPLPDDGVESAIAAIMKLYRIGKTKAQVRAALEAGLVVTV